MGKIIKILHLEDVETDALLTAAVLEGSSLKYESLVVDNKPDYIKALKKFAPDIILSDHSLPGFDSLDALKILKDGGYNIPFILVTGKASEEFAVSIMREGASDYLLKDRLQRLPTAIFNAIEKSELEKEQLKFLKELITNEAFLIEAEKIANIGSMEIELKSQETKWSPGMYRILGYHIDEMKPSIKHFIERVHPEDLERVNNEINFAIHSRHSANLNFRISDEANRIKYIHAKILIHSDRKGNAAFLKGFAQDVTEVALSEKSLYNATEELRIEKSIKEAEARYRLALEQLGDNVWEHDFKTDTTLFFSSERQFFGYDTDTLTANRQLLSWIVFKDDRPLLHQNDLNYKNGSIDSHSLEYRMIAKDGSIKWVLDRGTAIEKDGAGKAVRIIGSYTDISGIKQTELELSQRVMQFKSLSENIPGVIYEFEFSPDGTEKLRYISPAMQSIFGIEPEAFKNYLDYVHPEDRERIIQKNEHSKRTLTPFYDESRLIIPGVGERWHAVHSSFSYYTETGSKIFTGFMMDITERRNAEEKLRSNEEKYRGIIANMKLGLVEVDNNERITFANQSFCTMSGYAVEEVLGDNAGRLLTNGQDLKTIQRKQRMRKNGSDDAYEVEIRNKAGEARWWLVSAASRLNDKRERVGSIGIVLDISDQKKLEIELVDARQNAEHLASVKEMFLANMSHEIRTPMNAILGMGKQLGKTGLGEQQRLYLDTINSAAENLLSIINDILDLSKIEAGKINIEQIGFSPRSLLDKSIQVLALNASQKGISLCVEDFDAGISPVLVGDPHRISQVLLNLIGNAIKFTEVGRVDVSVKLLEDDKYAQTIHFQVKDTGIGIEESFLKHLFDKFSQENDTITRTHGGTGLGMSICKELVERMGGTIYARSKKGVGTTISFILDLPKGEVDALSKSLLESFSETFLKDKKVLVADDNDMNRLLATIILQNYGAEVIEAIDGRQAVEMCNRNPDIILMDIQMPVLNGFDATRELRANGVNTPIIALTANAMEGERERSIGAGMNHYISKPFEEQELLRLIDDCMNTSKVAAKEFNSSDKKSPLFDLTGLIAVSRGNEAFVQKMVKLFCDQAPQLAREMLAACKAGNCEKVAKLAHKIKPSIDNLSIHSLKPLIRKAEKATAENMSLQELELIVAHIDNIISETVIAMS